MAESDTGSNDQKIGSRTSPLVPSDVPAHEASKPEGESTSRRQSDRDLAGVLHEVSNALTVVLGWIDRARVELDGASSVEDALTIAATRARHARQIVRRAIGADVPDDAPCAVATLLRDAITGCEPEATRAGVTLRMKIDSTVEDAQLMGGSIVLQVLTNLLLNAVAVSPSRGMVFLDATSDAMGQLVFGVTDEGPGVPVERRANLLDAGVTTRAGGAGIGLRYAAGLARELGGSLLLVRAEPGARFELRWPRRTTMIPLPPRSNSRPGLGLAGRRILIIEDDDAVFDLLDATLGTRGAELLRARNRAELVEVVATNRFDAVLCDLSPIREDVVGAIGSIRESSVGARLVVISGSSDPIAGLPLDWGVSYVRKPFELHEIVAEITR